VVSICRTRKAIIVANSFDLMVDSEIPEMAQAVSEKPELATTKEEASTMKQEQPTAMVKQEQSMMKQENETMKQPPPRPTLAERRLGSLYAMSNMDTVAVVDVEDGGPTLSSVRQILLGIAMTLTYGVGVRPFHTLTLSVEIVS